MRDWDRVVTNIAAQTHWFGGKRVMCYHAFTYGLILGEVMRRVDGRKPAQFFREEIAWKAGIDLQIGLSSPDEMQRLAPTGFLDPPSADVRFADDIANRAWQSMDLALTPKEAQSWETRSTQNPGGSAVTNARALARLCAIPTMGGTLDGVRYLSKAIIDEASSEQAYDDDLMLGPARMGLGFGLDSKEFPAPSPTTFHWGGYGGSFATMDQANAISCGYAMNNFFVDDIVRHDVRRERFWKSLGAIAQTL